MIVGINKSQFDVSVGRFRIVSASTTEMGTLDYFN